MPNRFPLISLLIIAALSCGGASTSTTPTTASPTATPKPVPAATINPTPSPMAVQASPTPAPVPTPIATLNSKTSSHYRIKVEEHTQVFEKYVARVNEIQAEVAIMQQERDDQAFCQKLPGWAQEVKGMLEYIAEARPDFKVALLTALADLDNWRDSLNDGETRFYGWRANVRAWRPPLRLLPDLRLRLPSRLPQPRPKDRPLYQPPDLP